MEIALRDLISAYVETAEELFPRVAAHLGASLPISNVDWVCLRVEQIGETEDGIKYFEHGFGVNMDDGTRRIEFDLGTGGEMNGFDAWRLFYFAEVNGIKTRFRNAAEVQAAMDCAEKAGRLVHEKHKLYYLCN